MEKFKIGFNGANLEGSYDGNSDGENSVSIKVNMMEVLDELKNKGQAEVADAKVRFVQEGASIKILIDNNKDGEEFFTLEVNLAEVVDEVL